MRGPRSLRAGLRRLRAAVRGPRSLRAGLRRLRAARLLGAGRGRSPGEGLSTRARVVRCGFGPRDGAHRLRPREFDPGAGGPRLLQPRARRAELALDLVAPRVGSRQREPRVAELEPQRARARRDSEPERQRRVPSARGGRWQRRATMDAPGRAGDEPGARRLGRRQPAERERHADQRRARPGLDALVAHDVDERRLGRRRVARWRAHRSSAFVLQIATSAAICKIPFTVRRRADRANLDTPVVRFTARWTP